MLRYSILPFIFFIIIVDSHGQEKYDEILAFGQYKNNWAFVIKDDHWGFIDKEGNEIAEPITMNLRF